MLDEETRDVKEEEGAIVAVPKGAVVVVVRERDDGQCYGGQGLTANVTYLVGKKMRFDLGNNQTSVLDAQVYILRFLPQV